MTKFSQAFKNAFQTSQQLYAQGQVQAALNTLAALLSMGEGKEQTLSALAHIHLQQNDHPKAIDVLQQLMALRPELQLYCDTLAGLYTEIGRNAQAVTCYQAYLKKNPRAANGHFNLARAQKNNGQYEEALTSYQKALTLEISEPEEVYSNMSVIHAELHRDAEALAALEQALSLNPQYVPALHNIAARYEDRGAMKKAEAYFKRALAVDPEHYLSLARLAGVKRYQSSAEPLVRRLQSLAVDDRLERVARLDINHALAKVMNDLGEYDQAFAACQRANEVFKDMLPAYDPLAHEASISKIIETFNKDWFASLTPVSTAEPLFICGMFRSGSTLAEQILAAHPQVTAGGELEYFVSLAAGALQPFPQSIGSASVATLKALADDYLALLEASFPGAGTISDKRPDNFLYLGLIKTLFPRARIVHTQRNPLDNCLSVYFAQLGPTMNYATDLSAIAHYYRQQQRLMAHWQALFGGTIFELCYDDLVATPKPIVAELLRFCGLDDNAACLDFHQLRNTVNTASAWQVRQPLYRQSSGRWRLYQQHLGELCDAFPDAAS